MKDIDINEMSIERLRVEYLNLKNVTDIIIAAKDKKIEQLKEALETYGQHIIYCKSEDNKACSCGFEQALKENEE